MVGRSHASPSQPAVAEAVESVWDGRSRLFPWNRFEAYRRIRRLSTQSGKPIGPHGLRHTAVTLMLSEGAPLHWVQRAMGHADPRTTMRYEHTLDDFDNHPSRGS